MTGLPAPLEPLADTRRELVAILDLLDQESDPTIRADLAFELVGSCARYEDVIGRAVYPALRQTMQEPLQLDRAESAQQAIRDALADIRGRTQNVKPADVHASDPEGFEEILVRLVDAIRDLLHDEEHILFPTLGKLEGSAIEELCDDVKQAVDHASTHPNPPSNTVARAIVVVVEKLNRNVHDQSTVSHPEIDQLHEDLKSAADTE